MIGYVTVGTNDMARAGKFYDALLAEVGGKRQMETERFISWSAGEHSPGIGVIKPFRRQGRECRQRQRWSRSCAIRRRRSRRSTTRP